MHRNKVHKIRLIIISLIWIKGKVKHIYLSKTSFVYDMYYLQTKPIDHKIIYIIHIDANNWFSASWSTIFCYGKIHQMPLSQISGICITYSSIMCQLTIQTLQHKKHFRILYGKNYVTVEQLLYVNVKYLFGSFASCVMRIFIDE